MEFVVLGAGAIGGVVGGRLFQAGHGVTLVARGAHLTALRRHGLRVESPWGVDTAAVPVVGRPSEIDWSSEHVVLLAVKSQQTQAALADLAGAAPPTTPIICLQNGIANEPAVLRLFAHVYGVHVACPASHLRPGVVQAWSTPVTGILDVGRYPHGSDSTCQAVAAAFASATFDARAVDDVHRWKARKLLGNLANAIDVVCTPESRHEQLYDLLESEGEAILAAAGVAVATAEEELTRRGDLLRLGTIGGASRPGGSSWQSLSRNTGDIETDYLNGEIVVLGRMHAVPTPANALMQQLARECLGGRQRPRSLPEADILRTLRHDHDSVADTRSTE